MLDQHGGATPAQHPEIEAFDPDFADAGHVAHMASVVLPLALDRQRWIRRRLDRISLESEKVVRWDMQFEFTIPDLCSWIGEEVWLTRVPFPLSLHSKQIVTHFQMTDESGTEYSMLTTVEYRAVISRMLETLAASVLQVTAIDDTLAQLIRAVVDSVDDSHAARQCLEGTAQGKTLLENGAFAAMIKEVEDQFMIIALLDYQIGTPWIIHITYEEPLRVEATAPRLPWKRPATLATPSFAIDMADSYHAEFDPPPGLEFDLAHTAVAWELGANPPRQHRERVLSNLVALHAAGAARGAYAQIQASWVPAPGGAQRLAWYVSAVTSFVFAVPLAARLLLGIKPSANSGAAASVLLAIPALYALIVVQPWSHPVTGQYARAPRVVMTAAGFLALLGAATLATQFPPTPEPMAAAGIGWRTIAWAGLGFASLVLAWIAYRWR